MGCVLSTTVDCMKNILLFKFYKFSKMSQENRWIFRSKKIRGFLGAFQTSKMEPFAKLVPPS